MAVNIDVRIEEQAASVEMPQQPESELSATGDQALSAEAGAPASMAMQVQGNLRMDQRTDGVAVVGEIDNFSSIEAGESLIEAHGPADTLGIDAGRGISLEVVAGRLVVSATGGGAGLDIEVVQQLPQAGDSGTLYLVPNQGGGGNVYDEYIWLDASQAFEKIGTTETDLSGYVTDEELAAGLATKSDTGHTHAASDITSGTLPLSRGGTGYGAGSTQDLLDELAMDIASDYGAIWLDDSEHVRIDGPLPEAYGGTGATSLKSAMLDVVYPVGSIYMSVNAVSPATLFGGNWERITGRFLLAATDNGSSGASQAAGNTGGAATVTLTAAQSGVPAHAHGMGHRHTHAHTHGMGHRHTHAHTHGMNHKHVLTSHTHGMNHKHTIAHTHSYSKAASHTHNLSAAGGASIDWQAGSNAIVFHSNNSSVSAGHSGFNNYWGTNGTGAASERSTANKALLGKTDATTPGATATNTGAASNGYSGNSITTGSSASAGNTNRTATDAYSGYTGNSITTGSSADAGNTARNSTDAASTNYTSDSINTGSDAARTSTDAASTNYTSDSINTGNDNARTSTDDNTAADASAAHENMPPYLAVYVWKRTA